jgi:arginase
MSVLVVLPFHQDQILGSDSIAVFGEAPATCIAPRLPDADQWQRLVTLYDALAIEVASQVGTLAGAQRGGLDPSLVWFDAHGDVHTMASSTSGYLGGMALRMAMGGDADKLAGPLGLKPVAEDRAVLVGARDLDPAEVLYLARSQVQRRAVQEIGADDLPDGPIIVHIDLDVIDPAEVPGLRFPAPGGPSKAEVLAAVHRLTSSGRVSVLDVACPWFEPTDDGQQRVRRALLTELLDRSTNREPPTWSRLSTPRQLRFRPFAVGGRSCRLGGTSSCGGCAVVDRLLVVAAADAWLSDVRADRQGLASNIL